MSVEAIVVSNGQALKLKPGYTWQEKVKLCERWKQSGLSKVMYCKRNNLVFSTFCGWCDRLWPKVSAGQFCEVVEVSSIHQKEEVIPMTVEVCFPNEVSAKVSLHKDQVLNLIKELVYAASTPR